MNTELYVIRHGQTIWNQQRRLQGQMDSPLTSEGLKQAENLAERLQHLKIDALYASDLGRTMLTARIISAKLNGQQIYPDIRLRERNFGIFHGLNWEEIMKRFPEEGSKEKETNSNYIIPGGESRKQVLERCILFMQDIAIKHEGGRILAITHGGIVSSIVRYVLNIPLDTPRRFYLPNAALNVFDYNGSEWFLKTLGEISFHEDEDLSDGIQ
jgi:2,3-bisphosphoglycerate-dependent phosphoglycerate mutase